LALESGESSYAFPMFSSVCQADAAELRLPGRDDLPIVDVVGDVAFERGQRRAEDPLDPGPQLGILIERGRTRRQWDLATDGAQGRIRGQELDGKGVDGRATDIAGGERFGQGVFVDQAAARR
jgi:hypothetical protein